MYIHSCVHGMKLSTVVYGWLHCCCLGVRIDTVQVAIYEGPVEECNVI